MESLQVKWKEISHKDKTKIKYKYRKIHDTIDKIMLDILSSSNNCDMINSGMEKLFELVSNFEIIRKESIEIFDLDGNYGTDSETTNQTKQRELHMMLDGVVDEEEYDLIVNEDIRKSYEVYCIAECGGPNKEECFVFSGQNGYVDVVDRHSSRVKRNVMIEEGSY